MGILDKMKKDQPAKKAAEKAPKAVEKTTPVVVSEQVSRKRPVIIKPLVTEKASVSGTYYFKVDTKTNKSEVKKAFETLYGKKPRKVNIMNMVGKQKRSGRVIGKRADWKKAVVYLNKGETIDLFA